MEDELPVVGYYESILRSGNCEIVKGHVFTQVDHDSIAVVDHTGKAVVIPNKAVLSGTDWDKFVAFHPLCEDISRGQSEIIKFLTKLLQYETNLRVVTLIEQLVKINKAGDQGGVTPPAQHAMFKVLAGADAKFYDFVLDADKGILANVDPEDVNKVPVRFKLRRRTEIDGVEYRRYCSVTFPMYPDSDKDKICGVSGRVKDVRMWSDFLEYLFEGIDDDETYSYGTQRITAPNLGALLGAYSRVSERINAIVDAFEDDKYPLIGAQRVDLSFNRPEFLESLTHMAASIPPLRGNAGIPSRAGEEAAEIKLADPAPANTIRRPDQHPAPLKEDDPSLPWNSQQQGAPRPTETAEQNTTAVYAANGEKLVSVAEVIAQQRAQQMHANLNNPTAAHQQWLAQQQAAIRAQAPPADPNTMAGMLQARNMAQNLQLGVTALPGVGVGLSPFDVDYRPPASSQPQTQANAPMARPAW